MDNKPFSAPSPDLKTKSEVVDEPVKVLPPTTVSVGTIGSPVNVLSSTNPHSTSPHQIVVQEKGSNTVANVFLIIGVVVFVMGLVFMGVGGKSFGDRLEMVDEIGAKKVSKMQPLFYDTIVFSSDGNTTNESFEFNTDIWYNVRVAQGVTINSISILDENNNTLYFEEKCQDGWPEDGIDDCKDFTTVDIGNIDWDRSFWTGSEQFINGTININATGEVTIHNFDDDFWNDLFEINEQVDGEYFGGPVLIIGLGFCVGCCIAPVGLLVGIILRFA
jgi:hypothetical protein